tara:strand:- start:515 stop:814 length:300 start_codon:yes stop_codon:yes gene_type:complete
MPRPTHTQVPDVFLDYWLLKLRHSELKVLLVLTRKILGWHEVREQISLSQLERCTGLDTKNVLTCVNSLVKKGLIKKEVVGENGSQNTVYTTMEESFSL